MFKPPKPELQQSLLDLMDLFAGQFSEDKFASGVRRSFVRTGMVPGNDGEYEECLMPNTIRFGICEDRAHRLVHRGGRP
jgi:hypothetical protein